MLVVRKSDVFIGLRFRNLQNCSVIQEINKKASMFPENVQYGTF